ncbi:MAG: ABC transporter ATP-binding protein [Treponema sp.]|jgi:simple sugar transport system ATP-binding protein|nr:ABC transporter ATP-binding protein [Treponema sp.]
MNDAYIVEMRHITKKFPGIVANDDISLHIRRGEIFALLGENGAGKSTLMSMLFGMYEPDAGEIVVRGKPVKLSSSNDAAALNIGMVHQHFKLVQNYTVTENIVLGVEPEKRLFGCIPYVDTKNAVEQIRNLSKSYGLEVDPNAIIEQLPVSTQQRVEILKMLYRDAEILIFDEPTAVLTPQEIEYLLQIMQDLRKSGKTIILITHKLEEIKKIADRCAILLHGKLVQILDVAATTTREMASLMVGRDISPIIEKAPPNFGDVVLDVRHITVHNEDAFDVVKDVSFAVRANEIFAIAGVSGNGQVELTDAICGLTKITSGTVMLSGVDITQHSIRQRIEAGIAYTPEDRHRFGVVLDFTLQDNLALKTYYKSPFSRNGILNQETFEACSASLTQKFDIRSAQGGRTITRSMSGGNQQKAIVAREIARDAPLLIFVQPTRGLDIGAIDTIHRQILAERDKGKAILLISLELEEIMALSDTIGVMYNGELLKVADAATLSTNEVGKYMMGVRT